jgi:hypothetical protein
MQWPLWAALFFTNQTPLPFASFMLRVQCHQMMLLTMFVISLLAVDPRACIGRVLTKT